jgi:HEPN domain-containing protein
LAKLLGATANVALAARLVEADYMECRYPDAAQGVPFEQFTDAHSEIRLAAAEEIKTWVLQQLNTTP